MIASFRQKAAWIDELSRENSTFLTVVLQIFWTSFAIIDEIYPWDFVQTAQKTKSSVYIWFCFLTFPIVKKVVCTIISRRYEVSTLQNRNWMNDKHKGQWRRNFSWYRLFLHLILTFSCCNSLLYHLVFQFLPFFKFQVSLVISIFLKRLWAPYLFLMSKSSLSYTFMRRFVFILSLQILAKFFQKKYLLRK